MAIFGVIFGVWVVTTWSAHHHVQKSPGSVVGDGLRQESNSVDANLNGNTPTGVSLGTIKGASSGTASEEQQQQPDEPSETVIKTSPQDNDVIPSVAAAVGESSDTGSAVSSTLPDIRYPPLKDVVQPLEDIPWTVPSDVPNNVRWNVTSDVSYLLNFSIAGFPKCGTSTMMEYLEKSPYTKVSQKERCELGTDRQAKLVRTFYEEIPEGPYIRGLKCPRDLENRFAMEKYQKYFPNTRFLVGMRHPIDWFQSFYNFRVYNDNPMPKPSNLVGSCSKYSRNVCTHRARFHVYLASFGKTPISDDELKYFPMDGTTLRTKGTNSKVFLYHVEQLKDEDPERQLQLRKDLTTFIGLPELLPPLDVWAKPGKNLTDEQLDNAHSKRLDICDTQHDHIRQHLINQGRDAAEWILRFFLQSNDVFVSSPEFFRELALAWESDPCDKQITP